MPLIERLKGEELCSEKNTDKVIFLVNLNSPRELASVLNIDPGDNFYAYYIPRNGVITEAENGRRGIYFGSLRVQEYITLHHVYFPFLGETDFQRKYFEAISNKKST